MKRECSSNRLKLFFFPHKVAPAIMLVWKFLKVVTSVLLLGDAIPPTFIQAICLWEKIKYLIPGLSPSQLPVSSYSDPLRSFQKRAASHGYLLNINLLTNLLANTWSKPEERKERQRGNKNPAQIKLKTHSMGNWKLNLVPNLRFLLKGCLLYVEQGFL